MKNDEIKIGTKLYLQQGGNSYGCIAEVKHPYTVVGYTTKGILIQECNLIFNGTRYFDTLPDDIKEDKNGKIIELRWSDKISGGCWWAYKYSTSRKYPLVAHFGKWEYYPYLD